MKNTSELIVMLTYNDCTVPNAAEIFEQCKETRARFWGFKEQGIPFAEMQALFARMKACGKTTCLEVVSYTEEECLRGAQTAAACGCDYLMGTLYFDSVNALCRKSGVRYMPFVGQVTARRSTVRSPPPCPAPFALRAASTAMRGWKNSAKQPLPILPSAVPFLTTLSGRIFRPKSMQSVVLWRSDMLEMLYPSAYLSDVFSIDYPKLQALGYQGVLFDIDNTLVHHGDDATPEIEHLFAYLNSLGLKILLFSDNSRQRVERFNRNIGVPFLAEAGKPDPAACRKAASMLGLTESQVICVGDQIFKDILGANRCGMASILVDFIRLPDEKHFGKRRAAEKIILWFYRKNRRCYNRLAIAR